MRQTGNSLQRLDVESDDLALILAAAKRPAPRIRRRARPAAGGGLAALLAVAGVEASDDLSFGQIDFADTQSDYRTAESAADLFDFAAICETGREGVRAFGHEHDADAHRGHLGEAFASPFASPFGGLAAHHGDHAQAASIHQAQSAAAGHGGAHEAGRAPGGHAAHDAPGHGGAQKHHASADDHGETESAHDEGGAHRGGSDRAGDHESQSAARFADSDHAGHGGAGPAFAAGVEAPAAHAYHGGVAGWGAVGDLDDALTALLGPQVVPAGPASSPSTANAQASDSFAHADHAPPEIIPSAGVDI